MTSVSGTQFAELVGCVGPAPWTGSGCVAGVDDEVGGFTVDDAEIKSLDALIRALDSDVRAHPQPPMFLPAPEDGTLSKGNPAFVAWKEYELEWNSFALAWSRWAADHQTVLSQTGDKVAAEFESFQARYNELRRRFVDFGGKTQAPASSSSGGPFTDLFAKHLPTVLLVGALAVGAWFVVPIFLAGAHR